jgi:hypothetical protein
LRLAPITTAEKATRIGDENIKDIEKESKVSGRPNFA